MSQKTLERIVVGIISVSTLIVLLFVRSLGNVVFSLALLVALVVPPFMVGTYVRFYLTPAIDSINQPEGRYEDFPLYIRVLIWIFVGLVMSWAWSYLVPFTFDLPLYFGRVAAEIGWKSLRAADGVWQYGWAIIFFVQYVVNLLFSIMFSQSEDFEDAFEYRDL